jgi:hypothetical protein
MIEPAAVAVNAIEHGDSAGDTILITGGTHRCAGRQLPMQLTHQNFLLNRTKSAVNWNLEGVLALRLSRVARSQSADGERCRGGRGY